MPVSQVPLCFRGLSLAETSLSCLGPLGTSRIIQKDSGMGKVLSLNFIYIYSISSLWDTFLTHSLEANQIYFVLPVSKLQQRLTASDMAALAVKASVAIQNASTKDGYRRKKARISPVLLVNRSASSENYSKINDGFQYNSNMNKPLVFDAKTVGVAGAGKLSRAGSVRKLQRFTSKRAKLAVRSFRLRLSTIHEGTDV